MTVMRLIGPLKKGLAGRAESPGLLEKLRESVVRAIPPGRSSTDCYPSKLRRLDFGLDGGGGEGAGGTGGGGGGGGNCDGYMKVPFQSRWCTLVLGKECTSAAFAIQQLSGIFRCDKAVELARLA
jgi:hypothetical protein